LVTGSFAASIAVLVFAIGTGGLILKNNLIMKLLSLNIVNTSSILFFIAVSYRQGVQAPIIGPGKELYADPLPQALVLTAIVINFGVLALSLIFAISIVRRYHTLDVKKIQREARREFGSGVED